MRYNFNKKLLSLRTVYSISDSNGNICYNIINPFMKSTFIEDKNKTSILEIKHYGVLDSSTFEIRYNGKTYTLYHTIICKRKVYKIKENSWVVNGKYKYNDFDISCKGNLVAKVRTGFFGDLHADVVIPDDVALVAAIIVAVGTDYKDEESMKESI